MEEQPVRIRYTTLEIGDEDIHIRMLKDHLQYADADGVAEKLGISSATWPLFGVIWPSGKVLAHYMADYRIAGKRILEIGCGIALASLVLNCRQADITATDYHPETEKFLEENVSLNKGRDIPFVRTGWEDEKRIAGEFDLIIGSDLLYERDHAELLSGFIERHASQASEVIIVDPNRGNMSAFSKKMAGFGYTHSRSKPDNTSYLSKAFPGYILSYHRE